MKTLKVFDWYRVGAYFFWFWLFVKGINEARDYALNAISYTSFPQIWEPILSVIWCAKIVIIGIFLAWPLISFVDAYEEECKETRRKREQAVCGGCHKEERR